MIHPLHLLFAADADAALVEPALRALRRVGYDPRPRFAPTSTALGVALEEQYWDVVFVALDGGTVWDALGWLRRQDAPPPVFVLAADPAEAEIVALLGEGVRDVVGTDRVERLGVSVARAVRERRDRGMNPSSSPEWTFYGFAQHMPIGLYRSTEDGRILFANAALAQMLGCDNVDDLLGEPVVDSIRYPREGFVRQIAEADEVRDFVVQWKRADGKTVVTRETAHAVRSPEGALLYFEGTMEDITEEHRALDDERRRVEQLEALVRFSTAVDAAEHDDDLHGAIIEVVEAAMQADVAVVLGRHGGEYDVKAWSSALPSEDIDRCRSEAVWKEHALEVGSFLVRDVEALGEDKIPAPLRTLMGENALRSFGSFPLLHRGQPFGALVAFYREPHTFSEGELRVAETLAWHAASAVSRWEAEANLRKSEASAREQTQRSLAQQRALNELTALTSEADVVLRRAVEVAARTAEVDSVGLWLADEQAQAVRCQAWYVLREGRVVPTTAPDVSIATSERVLASQRVVAIADAAPQSAIDQLGLRFYADEAAFSAVLIAPIRRQGAVVGFLTFEHCESKRAWTLDEQDFAGAVADLAALTMERQQRAAAEDALRESERRYRAISALAADYAYALRIESDGAAPIEWATHAFERISGYAPSEIATAKGLLALVHPDDRRVCLRNAVALLAGETVEAEVRIRTKSGDERWVRHRSRPVRDDEGHIRHIYSTGQDVTERKRFEAALVEAREQAEAMARQKSTFLANMSHEIRTPLTGIIGFAGILADEIGEEHREYVHLIERSGQRLLGTINSVLDLAQLESDGLEPELEPLDVAEEVRQAVLLLTPLAEGKGLSLHFHDRAEDPVAAADPMCLHRVLNNLVGNAIKFTESGEINVEVRADAAHVRIDVRDTGAGIDADFLPHLFSEFRRETKNSNQVGSGLGLAITKRLIELMGGEVTVESEQGVGSTFTIALPRTSEIALAPTSREGSFQPSHDASAEVQAADSAAESDAIGGNEHSLDESDFGVREDVDAGDEIDEAMLAQALGARTTAAAKRTAEPAPGESAGESSAPEECGDAELPPAQHGTAEPTIELPAVPATQPAAGPDAARILLITDDAEVRGRIRQALEGDFVVDAAEDARTALDRMARGLYDGLVLDIHLGGKQTGIGVLRVARTLPGYESVFAVALAATEDQRDLYLDAGFDRFLAGALASETLQSALQHVSARAAARRRARSAA